MSESHAVSRSIAVVAISSACRFTGQACGPAAQERCEPPPEPGTSSEVVSNWLLAAAYDTITSCPRRTQVPWKKTSRTGKWAE